MNTTSHTHYALSQSKHLVAHHSHIVQLIREITGVSPVKEPAQCLESLSSIKMTPRSRVFSVAGISPATTSTHIQTRLFYSTNDIKNSVHGDRYMMYRLIDVELMHQVCHVYLTSHQNKDSQETLECRLHAMYDDYQSAFQSWVQSWLDSCLISGQTTQPLNQKSRVEHVMKEQFLSVYDRIEQARTEIETARCYTTQYHKACEAVYRAIRALLDDLLDPMQGIRSFKVYTKNDIACTYNRTSGPLHLDELVQAGIRITQETLEPQTIHQTFESFKRRLDDLQRTLDSKVRYGMRMDLSRYQATPQEKDFVLELNELWSLLETSCLMDVQAYALAVAQALYALKPHSFSLNNNTHISGYIARYHPIQTHSKPLKPLKA